MREKARFIIWIVLFSFSFFLICNKTGWTGEWIQINPSVFDSKGNAAHAFQEAIFDANYLYVVTSDSDDLFIRDPNRSTILWSSKVYDDPNEWRDKSENLWIEVMPDENAIRIDKLFCGFGYVYSGAFIEGDFKLYRFTDPNQKQEVIVGQNTGDKSNWRIDNGEEFENQLYLGLYEEGYGVRLFRGDSSNGPLDQEANIDDLQLGDPNKISLLKHVDERLFVGTTQSEPGAVLLFTSDGNSWNFSSQEKFNDPCVSDDIVAFLSMAEFLETGWLLTEFKETGKSQWSLWKTGLSSEQEPQWEKQISSLDLDGPLSDPNILGLSGLQPIGEYLYMACLCNDGGRIWKNYRGENNEWILVPSPSDQNNRFDPNNLLSGIFYNPNDIDYIYAATKNNRGVQILTRLVPRMDITNLSMDDRFIGPEEDTIEMLIRPNWKDLNYWKDPNHIPDASFFYSMNPNAIQSHVIEASQIDPNGISLWEFDPNIMEKEGIYTLRLGLTYGEGKEGVVKYLSFAWDSNAPYAPKILPVGVGDGHLEVRWQASIDTIMSTIESAGLEDANFRQSIWRYELEWWPEDNPNQVSSRNISGEYTGQTSVDLQNLQNFTVYKIRIRTWDKAHNVSEWSETAEGMPEPTLGLTDLLNGCFISSLHSENNKVSGSSRRWFAGLKVGRYEPDAREAKLIYGEDKAWPVQLEIGWVHKPYLEVGISAGYMKLDGMAILAVTQKQSIDPLIFRMIPCSMSFRWIPFWNSEHILTPYLGGGINAWWYQEEKLKRNDKDGWNYGAHVLCGVRLLLDEFDPKNAKFLEKDFGVKDTYLTLEVVYNWIDNFGDSRLDLGGAFYQAGVLFLF